MSVEIPAKYRELGRIRIGEKGDRGQPKKLETFRLTSPSRLLLEKASAFWGGTVEKWVENQKPGLQWELITEVSELPVWVPQQAIRESQFFELWAKGGCQRRCNGQIEQISGESCLCARSTKRSCSLTTHLQVILPDLPDIGVFRLVTSSFYAAQELPGTVDFLAEMNNQSSGLLEAVLAIESRASKANGQTRHFIVPVLRLSKSPRELVALLSTPSELLAAATLSVETRLAKPAHIAGDEQERKAVERILTGIREKVIHAWNENPSVLNAFAQLRYGREIEEMSLPQARDLQKVFLQFKGYDELVQAYSELEYQGSHALNS
jgi:hypothetical protein